MYLCLRNIKKTLGLILVSLAFSDICHASEYYLSPLNTKKMVGTLKAAIEAGSQGIEPEQNILIMQTYAEIVKKFAIRNKVSSLKEGNALFVSAIATLRSIYSHTTSNDGVEFSKIASATKFAQVSNRLKSLIYQTMNDKGVNIWNPTIEAVQALGFHNAKPAPMECFLQEYDEITQYRILEWMQLNYLLQNSNFMIKTGYEVALEYISADVAGSMPFLRPFAWATPTSNEERHLYAHLEWVNQICSYYTKITTNFVFMMKYVHTPIPLDLIQEIICILHHL